MKELKTILLTTDFSETSKQAFQPALMLAEKFGAKILLVYVDEDRLPPFVGDFPGTSGVSMTDVIESHRKHAAEELDRIARSELGDRAEVETVMPYGIPHREIVQLAGQSKVDLIVMATHGRGFLAHALLGSTTERVIRHAPCPVLAIRESGAEP